MQCPVCGFACPGQEKLCPSCGRVLSSPRPAGAASAPRPKVGKGAVRLVVYTSLLFGLSQGFTRLCSSYLDAEQEQAESALMRQFLEQKRRVRESAQTLEGAEEGTAAEAPATARPAAEAIPEE